MLKFSNVHAFYGQSHVLQGVNFNVSKGEIVSLLGRNGVGRSTAIKAAMGLVSRTGSIEFDGEEISGLRTYQIARRGLGYVPESRDIYPTLTVEQNLLLGQKTGKVSQWTTDSMYEMFPRLKERRGILAGVLSGGEQQMLTLCRSLMGDPKFLMIDEPTEGLAPKVVAQVGEYLSILIKRGISLLLVEQKLSIAMEVSSKVYVMGHGSIVYEGTPSELRANSDVRKHWLEV